MPDDILDRLTWRDVADLNAHWKKRPPLQWMVQGFLGIKMPEEVEETAQQSSQAFFDTMSPEEFTAFLLKQRLVH